MNEDKVVDNESSPTTSISRDKEVREVEVLLESDYSIGLSVNVLVHGKSGFIPAVKEFTINGVVVSCYYLRHHQMIPSLFNSLTFYSLFLDGFLSECLQNYSHSWNSHQSVHTYSYSYSPTNHLLNINVDFFSSSSFFFFFTNAYTVKLFL